jgi:hypothetical protein
LQHWSSPVVWPAVAIGYTSDGWRQCVAGFCWLAASCSCKNTGAYWASCPGRSARS